MEEYFRLWNEKFILVAHNEHFRLWNEDFILVAHNEDSNILSLDGVAVNPIQYQHALKIAGAHFIQQLGFNEET